MRTSLAVKRVYEAKRRSQDNISAARSYGSTSEELCEMLIKTRADMGKVPQWAEYQIRGYQDALVEMLYERDLVFGGYDRTTGLFYSTHSDRDDYYGKHGYTAKQWHDLSVMHGHYWKHDTTKAY